MNLSEAHHGLCPETSLLICSLNWMSSDTTGHDTGLATGLSLAGVSGDFFILPQFFFFVMTDFIKG